MDVGYLHPAMHLSQTVIEPADPSIYMNRIGRRPVTGYAPRPVLQPVGKEDRYFTIPLFDAMALSFENQQAGQAVWPSLQETLKLAGLDGIAPYPVKDNRMSEDGRPYTGAVVAYSSDGEADPHSIAFQLDALKYQYGCFFRTALETGKGVVPAPAAFGVECPR